MEEQEDISQLVIGMAGNSLFNELFSGGQGLSNKIESSPGFAGVAVTV
jgi:hypothetical protein